MDYLLMNEMDNSPLKYDVVTMTVSEQKRILSSTMSKINNSGANKAKTEQVVAIRRFMVAVAAIFIVAVIFGIASKINKMEIARPEIKFYLKTKDVDMIAIQSIKTHTRVVVEDKTKIAQIVAKVDGFTGEQSEANETLADIEAEYQLYFYKDEETVDTIKMAEGLLVDSNNKVYSSKDTSGFGFVDELCESAMNSEISGVSVVPSISFQGVEVTSILITDMKNDTKMMVTNQSDVFKVVNKFKTLNYESFKNGDFNLNNEVRFKLQLYKNDEEKDYIEVVDETHFILNGTYKFYDSKHDVEHGIDIDFIERLLNESNGE